MSRILYSASGFTLDDAVAYYTGVAKWLLPHLKARPVSFKRYPDTIRGESFWEKDAPSFTPAWVKRFAVPRAGGELWLDMLGKFKRWILRPDLIAMPAGELDIDPTYYRGEVPKAWRSRVSIEDIGAYELIEGSYTTRRFRLWFSGNVLQGPWTLEKARHRSWRLSPE